MRLPVVSGKFYMHKRKVLDLFICSAVITDTSRDMKSAQSLHLGRTNSRRRSVVLSCRRVV